VSDGDVAGQSARDVVHVHERHLGVARLGPEPFVAIEGVPEREALVEETHDAVCFHLALVVDDVREPPVRAEFYVPCGEGRKRIRSTV
jgi:hypothetical protein